MPDMQVFAKRFWGFNPAVWPIVSFSLDGNRDNLLRESRPGDLVLFIGTEGEETEPDDRGRLLGLAEFGRNEIESADVLDLATLRPNAFDENGRLRWPQALPMTRAWRLVTRPRVTEVLQRQLPYGQPCAPCCSTRRTQLPFSRCRVKRYRFPTSPHLAVSAT